MVQSFQDYTTSSSSMCRSSCIRWLLGKEFCTKGATIEKAFTDQTWPTRWNFLISSPQLTRRILQVNTGRGIPKGKQGPKLFGVLLAITGRTSDPLTDVLDPPFPSGCYALQRLLMESPMQSA